MSGLQKVMKAKTISVSDNSLYSFPEKLIEFIEFFKNQLASIPEEYRETAYIDIESGSEYSAGSIEILYKRPETLEEEKFRKEQEQNREDDNKRYELRKLAELQKKYGVK